MIDRDTARELSPLLILPAAHNELIVRRRELYAEERETEARRALAQSLFGVAGVAISERRPTGRVADVKRGILLWNAAAKMVAKELKQADASTDKDLFVVCIATEYSRILQGPALSRLAAPLREVQAREPLVPRLEAVERYGRDVTAPQCFDSLVNHAEWLHAVAEKGYL